MKPNVIKRLVICSLIVVVHGDIHARARMTQQEKEKLIKTKVKQEVHKQRIHEKRSAIRKSVYGEKGTMQKQPECIYKIPRWPFASQFYEQRDLFQLDVQVSGATKAWFPTSSQDLASLVLNKNCITFKDLLLVSKLAKDDAIVAMGGAGTADLAILKALADHPLSLDASTWQIAGLFNFARHFLRGRLSLHVQFPLLLRQNKIDVKNELNDNARFVVASQPTSMFAGKTLREIYDLVLQENGLTTSRRATKSGLGDVEVALHYDIPNPKFDRIIAGIKLVFPTGPGCRTNKLWDADLNDGGFAKLGAFLSLLYHQNRWLNLHFHSSITGSFDGHVCRRVPRIFKSDGGGATCVGCEAIADAPFGENFMLVPNKPFCELESCLKGLGKEVKRIHMRPGIQGELLFGNIIERIITMRDFLDIFYGLRVKGRDHIDCIGLGDVFDSSVWRSHTDFIEHRIAADWSYQMNNCIRFALGTSYVFAGRYVPKTISGHFLFHVEF